MKYPPRDPMHCYLSVCAMAARPSRNCVSLFGKIPPRTVGQSPTTHPDSRANTARAGLPPTATGPEPVTKRTRPEPTATGAEPVNTSRKHDGKPTAHPGAAYRSRRKSTPPRSTPRAKTGDREPEPGQIDPRPPAGLRRTRTRHPRILSAPKRFFSNRIRTLRFGHNSKVKRIHERGLSKK